MTPAPLHVPSISRARDEQLLDWIRARAAGRTGAEVAAKTGAVRAVVIRDTNKVRRADEIESGEDIAGAYW